jgi:hypothetical protein
MYRRPCRERRATGAERRSTRAERGAMRARRGRANLAGVSLLECTVAVVILSISLMGITRLIVDHERILASVESWCAFEPEYYVARPTYDLERTLGRPAQLSTTLPSGLAGPPTDTPYHVVVISRSRGLHPESATAVVQVEEP